MDADNNLHIKTNIFDYFYSNGKEFLVTRYFLYLIISLIFGMNVYEQTIFKKQSILNVFYTNAETEGLNRQI